MGMAVRVSDEFLIEDVQKIGESLLGQKVDQCRPLQGGRNSRVYHLFCQNQKQYLLKFYFRSQSDVRDRLNVEFTSLLFLWEHAIQNIPRPIAMDKDLLCAVYEFCSQEKIDSQNVSQEDLQKLVDFIQKINALRSKLANHEFPPASEACFSVEGIVSNIRTRLDRLEKVQDQKVLKEFLDKEFKPFFDDVIAWSRQTAKENGISINKEISVHERILSPSDFGFHNTLRRKNGEIIFLDFEYFGWDDPAKLLSDFVLHPAMELTKEWKDYFVKGICQLFYENENLLNRMELVYPLFGLKWCMIFLNEFVQSDLARRNFARSDEADLSDVQGRQLSKARRMLGIIQNTYQRFPYKG